MTAMGTVNAAKSSAVTVSVCGQKLNCAPPAFEEKGEIWAPAPAMAKALQVDLAASDAFFKIKDSTATAPRKVKDKVEFVGVKKLASALDTFTLESPGKLDILARITDVRFSRGRLIISTSYPVAFQAHRLQNPERIYVDLPGTRLDGPSSETRSETSVVRSLKMAQFDPATVRVVAQTAKRVDFNVLSPARTRQVALALIGTDTTPNPPTDGAVEQPVEAGEKAPLANTLTTISDIKIEESPNRIRFVISADHKPIPRMGTNLLNGQLWLDFNETAVQTQQPEPQTGSGLFSSVKLEDRVTAPPSARLTVTVNRILVPKLSDGVAPGEINWDLCIPVGSEGDWQGKTIIMDPGHGGSDTGAQGNGLKEKNINLAIARAAAEEGNKRGLKCILTRDADITKTLRSRTDQISPNGATLFVSIHSNSNSSPNSVSGTEVYYHKQEPDSRVLAEVVHDKIITAVSTKARGARSDSKLYQSGLFVLRNSTIPAILVEVGYINNASEAARLKDASFQKKVAAAIVDGIITYLGGPLNEKVTTVSVN